jgi:hypothetical protein
MERRHMQKESSFSLLEAKRREREIGYQLPKLGSSRKVIHALVRFRVRGCAREQCRLQEEKRAAQVAAMPCIIGRSAALVSQHGLGPARRLEARTTDWDRPVSKGEKIGLEVWAAGERTGTSNHAGRMKESAMRMHLLLACVHRQRQRARYGCEQGPRIRSTSPSPTSGSA